MGELASRKQPVSASFSTIAKWAHVSERTVKYTVKAAKEVGELEVKHEKVPGNNDKPNKYTVLTHCPPECHERSHAMPSAPVDAENG